MLKNSIYFTIDSMMIKVPEGMGGAPPEPPEPGEEDDCCKCCCGVRSISKTSTDPVLFDTLQIDLPIAFVSSNNEKYITVNNARALNVETDHPYDIFAAACYSNLIQDNPYGDYFLTFCDEKKPFLKRIPIYDARTRFNIWFKGAKGHIIDLDPRKTRIVIELLLDF
jgi:hypothetical protein